MAENETTRRGFFKRISAILVFAGVFFSYGTFASYAMRFLYPRRRKIRWQFLMSLNRLKKGESYSFTLPSGVPVAIARQANDGKESDFVALSTTCPHLGCRVHWEGHNSRFFCPCHNGAFDAKGKATSGPPKDAKQELTRYPLKLEKGLVYIGETNSGLRIKNA